MKRCSCVIKVFPEKLEYCKLLHANPWPEVTEAITACRIRNFSIFCREGYLFSYYEYVGNDYAQDMEKLAALTRHWLRETDQCQQPINTANPGEWWSEMTELFHHE